jgi:hypothetical protein
MVFSLFRVLVLRINLQGTVGQGLSTGISTESLRNPMRLGAIARGDMSLGGGRADMYVAYVLICRLAPVRAS